MGWRASETGILAGFSAAVGMAAVAVAVAGMELGLEPRTAGILGLLTGVVVAALGTPALLRRRRRALRALENAVAGLRSRDYGIRLAIETEDELGLLARVFNELADELRRERSDLRQREILLRSVIESSPTAVVLVNAAGRVLLDNHAARRFLAGGSRLSGRAFSELVATVPTPLRESLANPGDTLVTADGVDGNGETFRVTVRELDVNSRRHRLVTVRRLTVELRRQETAAWKKVTRVIAHELNNTMAPIRSMVHSARKIRSADPEDSRLEEILGHIDDSAASLQRFVDGYRSLARLPEPRPEEIDLDAFLRSLANGQEFRRVGELPKGSMRADPGQLRLALVNVLKNAREAGSSEDDIELEVLARPEGGRSIRVRDRGAGLSDEALGRALIPFYSSKPGGSGLGLALAREIVEAHGGVLSISARQGGGAEVRFDLPAGRSPDPPAKQPDLSNFGVLP